MAISSSTDICNLTSDLLEAERVSNIEAPTTAIEEIYFRWYDHTRRALLRQHPWNFATRRVVLAASSTAPAFGATAAFPVPADFLRLLWLSDADGNIIGTDEYYFEAGSVMMRRDSDASSVNLVYISDVTDVTSFDQTFIDLLAVEIGLRCGYKVTQSNSVIDRLTAMRKQAIMTAKSVDGQERPPSVRRASINRRARMTLGTYDTTRYGF